MPRPMVCRRSSRFGVSAAGNCSSSRPLLTAAMGVRSGSMACGRIVAPWRSTWRRDSLPGTLKARSWPSVNRVMRSRPASSPAKRRRRVPISRDWLPRSAGGGWRTANPRPLSACPRCEAVQWGTGQPPDASPRFAARCSMPPEPGRRISSGS